MEDYRKIAIYARQSIDKPDSYSIETQVEACEDEIERQKKRSKQSIPKVHKNEVLDLSKFEGQIVTYTDPGYSGKNMKRPAFQKMMDAINNNEIKLIMVYKLDRISRSLKDFMDMWEIFEKHNVEFYSINENFDTTSTMGKAMLQIAMVFAQMERENTQMRVKDNYYKRTATDGRWAGGPAPYGFVNAKTKDGIPTLKVDEQEMEMVKYIFDEYANRPNISLGQICKNLKKLGYRSKRANGAFDNVTLARMLQNPVYVKADEHLYTYFKLKKINFLNDKSAWDGTRSAHLVGKRSNNCNYRKYATLEEQSIYITNFEGVIDSLTFMRVADRLAQNQQIRSNNKMSPLIEFQGLIKCSKCGYAIRMDANGCLYCYNNRNLHSCDQVYSNVDFNKLREDLRLEVQPFLNEMVQKVIATNQLRAEQQREIDKLQQQLDNLINLASMGGKSAKSVHNKMEEIQEEIDRKLLENYTTYRFSDNLHIRYKIPLKYYQFSDEEKKSVCQFLIDKILLHENGDMDITWKI